MLFSWDIMRTRESEMDLEIDLTSLKQNFEQFFRRGQRLFVETPLSCIFSNTFLVKGPIHAHMSKLEIVFEFCFLSSEN